MPQHNQQFIEEMKQLLTAEKANLEREITREEQFPEYGRHDDENAAEMADYSAAAATEETLEARLKEVDGALQRIVTGTYGQTENGELIPEERLRANPAAITLVKR